MFRALDALSEPITTKAQAVAWKGTLLTPDRSPQVVNGIWLGAPRTVWKWAVENGLASDNPFVGVRVAAPKRRVQVRERQLRDEEWKTILRATLLPIDPQVVSAPVARLRRWAPWLLAHTGARGGEITQLQVEDVTEVAGAGWCLNLTPDAGTIKTGSARVVPLHAQVIAQGFLEVVKEVGSGPLFYRRRAINEAPRSTAGRTPRPPAVKARETLAAWVKSLGIPGLKDGLSPLHAWRHTWKRIAARAGIEATLRDAVVGHSPRDIASYYERPSLEDLAVAIKRFPRYSLD